LKDYEEKIERVRDEVAKAIQMLNEEHTGADIAQARRILLWRPTSVKKA